MDIQTILECLNAAGVRATYGAVGEVLGVRPQVVPRLLGERRPAASWVVNGTTGEPTGYASEEVDPRLPGTHVIRTGNELRACLEGGVPAAPEGRAPAAPEAVAPEAVAPEAVAPEAVAPEAVAPEAVSMINAAAGPATPEPEPFGMNSDAKWIIGTLVPVFLLVAGLLAAQIASVSRGLNTRIDEVNGRIDDLTERVGGVDAGIGDVRAEFQEEIAVLRSDVGSIADRLAAVEPGGTDPGAAAPPDAGGQAVDPDAPEAASDSPEAAVEAAEPAAAPQPEPEPEPPAEPDTSAANPAPPRE